MALADQLVGIHGLGGKGPRGVEHGTRGMDFESDARFSGDGSSADGGSGSRDAHRTVASRRSRGRLPGGHGKSFRPDSRHRGFTIAWRERDLGAGKLLTSSRLEAGRGRMCGEPAMNAARHTSENPSVSKEKVRTFIPRPDVGS